MLKDLLHQHFPLFFKGSFKQTALSSWFKVFSLQWTRLNILNYGWKRHTASSVPSLCPTGNSFKYFCLSQIIWETWDFDTIMLQYFLGFLCPWYSYSSFSLNGSRFDDFLMFLCSKPGNDNIFNYREYLLIHSSSVRALLPYLPPVMQNKIALAITTYQIKALVSWWPVSYFLESGKQFFPNQVEENDDYLDNSLYCQILFFQTTMLSSCGATNTNLIQRKSGFRSERGEHLPAADQQKETFCNVCITKSCLKRL